MYIYMYLYYIYVLPFKLLIIQKRSQDLHKHRRWKDLVAKLSILDVCEGSGHSSVGKAISWIKKDTEPVLIFFGSK